MADPLSVAAGILAILHASGKTVQGLKLAWQLRRRRQDFLDLNIQLAGLRMQLRVVHLCIDTFDNSSDKIVLQECMGDFNKLLIRAEAVLLEIDDYLREIFEEAERSSKKKTAAPDQSLKPSKRLWVRRKSTLATLTEKVTSIVKSLMATVQVLQSHRPSSLPKHKQHVVIQSISTIQELPDPASQQDPGTALEHQIERAARQLERIEVDDDGESSASPRDTHSISRRSSVDSFHSVASRCPDPASSFVSICGTLGAEPCRQFCLCQCHISTHIRMPAWTKNILGSISFHGNGSIFLNRRPCDRPLCGRGGPASVQFSYYAPAWTFFRSFSFHVKAQSISGLKSPILLNMPRVIPNNALVWSTIEFGRLSELRQMLDRGETSPHDVTYYGSSILYWAAFKGQTEIYSYLISQGADPYFQDEDGMSCIQPGIDRALSGTRVDRDLVCMQPKTSDADQIFVNESSLDRQEFTLLHRIVLSLHGMCLIDYLVDVGKGIDTVDVNGRTPLLWAVWRGDVETVTLLLQAKANIDKQDYQGYTPLARAAKAGHIQCVRVLLQFGASLTKPTSWGAQPIHLASDNKQSGLAVVQELVASGADPEAPSELGAPLHNAANRGSLETVKYLVSKGVDIDLVDQDGDSPAMVALMCSNQSIFCYLATEGAKLNNVRKSGENILHIACWCGSEMSWEALERASKEGRLMGLDLKAKHEGHDMWHCLDKCRSLWYMGEVHDEKVVKKAQNLLRSLED